MKRTVAKCGDLGGQGPLQTGYGGGRLVGRKCEVELRWIGGNGPVERNFLG